MSSALSTASERTAMLPVISPTMSLRTRTTLLEMTGTTAAREARSREKRGHGDGRASLREVSLFKRPWPGDGAADFGGRRQRR